MVTIITEIIGSPIRGLKISRSITKPRAHAISKGQDEGKIEMGP